MASDGGFLRPGSRARGPSGPGAQRPGAGNTRPDRRNLATYWRALSVGGRASPTYDSAIAAAPTDVDLERATAFVAQWCGAPVAVEYVGEGVWSRCFGFGHDDQALVIRFGHQRDDFEKDRVAGAWASAALPTPVVLAIGEAFDGYYCVSTRAYGVALESLDADGWRAVAPNLLSVFDALREVDDQCGAFGAVDFGRFATWREFLLSVRIDSPRLRTHGWSRALAANEPGRSSFADALDRLDELASRGTVATANVVHNDTMNRNVLVEGDRVTALLDWGCMFAGDHLYEVAQIDFWEPWYPALGSFDFRAVAIDHLDRAGVDLDHLEDRLEACAIHIGLAHIAYTAFIRDWSALTRIVDRMETYRRG